MSKQKTRKAVSQVQDTLDEAIKVAKANQRPAQTKEQTKLIAQGIQKGIEQYKKQQSAKARDLDKKLKKVRGQQEAITEHDTSEVVTIYRQSKLAWILLAMSWIGFALILILFFV